jgi:putative ABC transport system substrate-binding protein
MQFLILFVAAFSMSVSDVLAEGTDKTKRVGYLVWSSYGARGHLEQALLDGMRDEGYVEGKNLVVERRYVDRGSFDEVRRAASELAALNLDAIVSTCSPSTTAAKEATAKSSIPVVMAFVSDPVGQGLIASYRRPGGNITGLSSQAEDTLPKMLQYLSEVMPTGARVAVLYNTNNPVHPRLWQLLQQAGKERGTNLVQIDVSGRADFAAAFDTIGREHLGGLLVLPDDNMTYNARVQLNGLVQRQRIPAIFGAREFVDIGGLMSYGPSLASNYRHAAVYVDKVLKGAKPANTPVEQPTHFEFVVNLAAAKALGIAIPQALLLRADDIVRVAGAPTNRALDTTGKSEERRNDGM